MKYQVRQITDHLGQRIPEGIMGYMEAVYKSQEGPARDWGFLTLEQAEKFSAELNEHQALLNPLVKFGVSTT